MRATTSWSGLIPAILVAAAAAGMVLPVAAVSAEAPKPCVTIVAPSGDAVLPPGTAIVIGSARGESVTSVDIDVNGKGKKSVAVSGGGFSAAVPLSKGRNVIRVVAGKASASVAVVVEAKGGYRYHPEIEKCAGCHDRPERGYAVSGPQETICYRCHDRQDAKKNVHGPLGGGECAACHDPHGSGNAALTTARHETLCVSCHDQESSADHFRRSKGKACTACHEPHSSDRQFLQK